MNEKTPHGPPEQREKPILEIWVIEDDESVRGPLVDVISAFALGSRCIGFERAEVALRELEKRVSEGNPTPAGIFVDGNLSKDTVGFDLGPLVVEKIRTMQRNSEAPFIVAISSDLNLNNAMIQNGADLIVSKPPKIPLLRDALEKIQKVHDKIATEE